MTGSLHGKTVLVTGASGFIGGHLCRRLAREGAHIHGIWHTHLPQKGNGIHWHRCNVEDHGALAGIFRQAKPDVVFHLSSVVTGSRERAMVMPTLRGNLVSTINLLDLASEQGCERVVLAGSLEEGGSGDAPASPYAAAKAASSAYARMFHNLYGTPVVNARLFMVYGPAQRDVTKLIPHVTLAMLRGEIPRLSSGTRPVDWIFVEDVVEGLMRCASTPGIEGETVDFGSGELVTIRAVVEQLAAIISPQTSPDFGALPDRPYEQVRQANVAHAKALTGWEPSVPLAEGLRRTVDHYRRLIVDGGAWPTVQVNAQAGTTVRDMSHGGASTGRGRAGHHGTAGASRPPQPHGRSPDGAGSPE